MFVVCWLPFFTLATVRPFCGARCGRAIPPSVVSLIVWLGYDAAAGTGGFHGNEHRGNCVAMATNIAETAMTISLPSV